MKFLIIFLANLLIVINGYRILGVFPHFGISHFYVFHPIMRGLAEAGHNVSVVSYFPDKNPHPNYKDFILKKDDYILTESFDVKVTKLALNNS